MSDHADAGKRGGRADWDEDGDGDEGGDEDEDDKEVASHLPTTPVPVKGAGRQTAGAAQVPTLLPHVSAWRSGGSPVTAGAVPHVSAWRSGRSPVPDCASGEKVGKEEEEEEGVVV